MERKLTKVGNSYALIIPKLMLELLEATPETVFKINMNDKTVSITPMEEHAKKLKIVK